MYKASNKYKLARHKSNLRFKRNRNNISVRQALREMDAEENSVFDYCHRNLVAYIGHKKKEYAEERRARYVATLGKGKR